MNPTIACPTTEQPVNVEEIHPYIIFQMTIMILIESGKMRPFSKISQVGIAAAYLVVVTLLQKPVGLQACHLMEVDGDSKKLVCVCTESSCDKLRFDWPKESGQAVMVQSTESGLRFASSAIADHFADQVLSVANTHRLQINLGDRRQKILGWGGGFTDSVGINLSKLSNELASKLLASYYGKHGLQYNFGRVPIGGTDFSPRAYSYDDSKEPDYNLTGWSLANEDILYKMPYIKKAIRATNQTGLELKLIASPWSPPKWMKTNNNFARGKLIDEDKIYNSYTEYLMKFYEAYERDGIKFWGQTVQNEPILSNNPLYSFNSVQFGNDQMTKFISDYLGPALVARGKTKDKFKLMVGDDSLGLIDLQVPKIMQNKEVQKYISGLAFHWYTSGILVPYDDLLKVYESIKDTIEFVIMTEACSGSNPLDKKVDLGSWERGQRYAADIIEDLLRNTNAWIDWNLALDLMGGPTWAANFVDSPIIVNSHKGEFYRQPTYYVLAHFSRFFRPGSIVIGSKLEGPLIGSGLMSVSVVNKQTGHLIVNILNKSDGAQRVITTVQGLGAFKLKKTLPPLNIPGKSLSSIVVKL